MISVMTNMENNDTYTSNIVQQTWSDGTQKKWSCERQTNRFRYDIVLHVDQIETLIGAWPFPELSTRIDFGTLSACHKLLVNCNEQGLVEYISRKSSKYTSWLQSHNLQDVSMKI
jgi:hypothetical protein